MARERELLDKFTKFEELKQQEKSVIKIKPPAELREQDAIIK